MIEYKAQTRIKLQKDEGRDAYVNTLDRSTCTHKKKTIRKRILSKWVRVEYLKHRAIGYPCTELIPTFSTKSQLQVSHKRAIKLFLMIG